jgi:hypothetical protein
VCRLDVDRCVRNSLAKVRLEVADLLLLLGFVDGLVEDGVVRGERLARDCKRERMENVRSRIGRRRRFLQKSSRQGKEKRRTDDRIELEESRVDLWLVL